MNKTKSLLSWSSCSSDYVFQNVNAAYMLICQRLFAKKLKAIKLSDVKILRNNDKSRHSFSLKHVNKLKALEAQTVV